MTGGHRLRIQASKEARELLPVWAAGAVSIAASAALGWHTIAMLAFAFGATGLGAWSIGHEFGGRTLPILLAQPISRPRLLAIKASVLVVMLASISLLFAAGARAPDFVQRLPLSRFELAAAFFVPVVAALFTAPAITIAARNPAAGTVLSLSLLSGPLIAVNTIDIVFGFTIHPARVAIWSAFAIGAAAAVVGYRMFVRLEAIDGPQTVVGIRRSPAGKQHQAAPTVRRNPTWLLLAKELRLQRMTFILAALYPAGWLTAMVLRPWVEHPLTVFYIMSVFHCVEIALLSGATASAEERHTGTLEWQLLMPVSVRTQWLIKTAVVLATTVVFGCFLPAAAVVLAPDADLRGPHAADFVSARMIVSMMSIAAISLYTSSISRNSLCAAVAALPAVILVTAMTVFAASSNWLAPEGAPAAIVGIVGAAVMLSSAMVNHQLADRSPARVARQVSLAAAVIAGAVVAVRIAA